jgi:hypothetical protein
MPPLKHKGYFERCPYLLQRAALNAGAIALAALAAWLVFTPDPPRHCNYSESLKSCTWTL